ncbi:YbaK/EbsC family protein [Clostridium paraputrificum]|uniref:YbaK/EbsC family protein n=1 Tax=Clostridium paraputrificum TaxID=29363 RepID=UPI003D3409E8
MSIERVREYFKEFNKDKDIIVLEESSATVDLAAQALGVIPGCIAKTLSFKAKEEGCILVVVAGDKRIDNKKFKEEFGLKAKMLTPDEALEYTGHAVGGVCPFGISNSNVKVYLDESLKVYDTVYPACGSSNSAIKLTIDEIYEYSNGLKWVDICKESE